MRKPARRGQAVLYALVCAAFVLAILLLTGCAQTAWPHFTTPSGDDWRQACDPDCQA